MIDRRVAASPTSLISDDLRPLSLPPPDRMPDQIRRIFQIELLLDMTAVHVDGFGTEVQLCCNVARALALADELEDFKLTVA